MLIICYFSAGVRDESVYTKINLLMFIIRGDEGVAGAKS